MIHFKFMGSESNSKIKGSEVIFELELGKFMPSSDPLSTSRQNTPSDVDFAPLSPTPPSSHVD